MSTGLIPATILTGFLGSGKTTLLKRVLTEAHGQKIAVIENEFGEENIDNDILVADTNEQIIQMNNGCVCCTIREDLRTTLSDLADKRRKGELDFDRVVIETTGLADPGPVAQTFFMDDEIAESYLLDSILTLVDAKHADSQLDTRQEARRQVGFADQIFISKTDLVAEDEVDALIHRLKHMNPRAPQQTGAFRRGADRRGVRPARLQPQRQARHRPGLPEPPTTRPPRPCITTMTTSTASTATTRTTMHHDDDVKSFVFRADRAFNPAKLEDFLGAIVQVYGPKMLRYKGVLYMKGSDRKVIFQGVHQLMGSDLGPKWAAGREEAEQDGVHRHRPAEGHPAAGAGAVPGLRSARGGRLRGGRAPCEAAHQDGYNPRASSRRKAASRHRAVAEEQ